MIRSLSKNALQKHGVTEVLVSHVAPHNGIVSL